MMRRLLVFLVVAGLVAAACTRSEPSPTLTIPDAPDRTPVSPPTTTRGTTSSTSLPTTTAGTSSPSTSSTTTSTTLPVSELRLHLEPVASGFESPVLVTAPPGDERIFVVDKPGIVWVVDTGDPEVYLDIREDVGSGRLEQGLLGLAFAPDFAESGVFVVDYTDRSGSTVIASFVADPAGTTVDPATRTVHLTIEQPASNHNGGNVMFGPDGHLWIGMGDGGGADDRFGNGQNTTTQLGSLLRITPTADGFETPPRSGAIAVAEAAGVWAIGLRNPWRFSFDGDLLYVADVGQGAVEEVSVVDVREIDQDPRLCLGCVDLPNFGWPIQEGDVCFRSADCDPTGLIQPILVYRHDEGCSITGGHVYRGDAIPSLRGHYLYGDYCSGWVRSFRYDAEDESVVDDIEWFATGAVPQLTSFGLDGRGEIYVMSASGDVFRIAAAD